VNEEQKKDLKALLVEINKKIEVPLFLVFYSAFFRSKMHWQPGG
jgi:hypothetical protein